MFNTIRKKLKSKLGQGTVEYALMVGGVTAAAIAGASIMQSAHQGKMITEAKKVFGDGADPQMVASEYTNTLSSTDTVELLRAGSGSEATRVGSSTTDYNSYEAE